MTEVKVEAGSHRSALVWTLLVFFTALPCAVHLPEPHPLWSVGVLLAMAMTHALLLASAMVLAVSLVGATRPAWSRWAAGVGAVAVLTFIGMDAMHFGLLKRHLGSAPLNRFIEPEMLLAYDLDLLDLAGFAAWIALLTGLGLRQSRALPRPRQALGLVGVALVGELGLGLLGATVRYLGVQPLVGLVESMPLAFQPRMDGLLRRVSGLPPQAIDDDNLFPNPLGNKLEMRELRALALPDHADRTPDVLIVVLASLRADALADMPTLSSLAAAGLVGEEHRSSGNCSLLGSFGLFTGLSPTLWPVQRTWLAPRGLAAFQALGYEVMVRQSAQLSPNTEAKVLPPGSLWVRADPKAEALARDDQAVAWASEWLQHAGPRPRLAAVLLDATHWPYRVSGEPHFRQPLLPGWNDRDQTEAFRARYRRSVAGADARLGKLVAAQAAHHFDDLVLVVVGDDGEAFREHGVFGHGSRLDDEQLRVPLVLKLPGVPPGKVPGPSTHSDVLPTVLGYLGATPLSAAPAVGVDLLHGEARALPPLVGSCALTNPDGFAVLRGAEKILFQMDTGGAHFVDALDADGLTLGLDPAEPSVEALLADETAAYLSLLIPAARTGR